MVEEQIAYIYAKATLQKSHEDGEDECWSVEWTEDRQFTYNKDIRAGDMPVYEVVKTLAQARKNPNSFLHERLPEKYADWSFDYSNSVEVTAIPTRKTVTLGLAIWEANLNNRGVNEQLMEYSKNGESALQMTAHSLAKNFMEHAPDVEAKWFHSDEDLFETLESVEGFDPVTEWAVEG